MSKTRREVNRFFHGPVDLGHGNTADYVVAHGERQIQRGKNPSVTYRDPEDPTNVLVGRPAFEAAQADLQKRADDDKAYFAGRVMVFHDTDGAASVEDFKSYLAEMSMYAGAVGGVITQEPMRRLPPDHIDNGTSHTAIVPMQEA